MDIHSLDRFLVAQRLTYAIALREIQNGCKRSHWMWFIFPQLRGLGSSQMSYAYGLDGIEEAQAYLAHPILSGRLTEISEALLTWHEKGPEEIFGSVDAVKLHSSMTLFALLSKEGSVFHRVLDRFFHGVLDERTQVLIGVIK